MIVGFHPHFIMASGMPTHYDNASASRWRSRPTSTSSATTSSAGLAAGWRLTEMRERLIDDAWLALKPKWSALRGQPIAFAFAWG